MEGKGENTPPWNRFVVMALNWAVCAPVQEEGSTGAPWCSLSRAAMCWTFVRRSPAKTPRDTCVLPRSSTVAFQTSLKTRKLKSTTTTKNIAERRRVGGSTSILSRETRNACCQPLSEIRNLLFAMHCLIPFIRLISSGRFFRRLQLHARREMAASYAIECCWFEKWVWLHGVWTHSHNVTWRATQTRRQGGGLLSEVFQQGRKLNQNGNCVKNRIKNPGHQATG